MIVCKRVRLTLFILLSVTLTGCSWFSRVPEDAKDKQKQAQEQNQQQVIMQNFEAQIQRSDIQPREIITFIDSNIAQVSQENASAMIVSLEALQKQKLDNLQTRYNDDTVQRKIISQYPRGFDISHLDEVKNAQLKTLLTETISDGYKLETAEGTYFPVINYGAYRKYVSAVTPDMGDYIGIMANESDKVAAKDAALIIGWDEVVNRTMTMEKFIKDYPNSVKLEDVKQLYKRYVIYTFYGANNTPLFRYDSQTIVPEAKKSYQNALAKGTDSKYLATINSFLNLVDKSGNKLTNEVDQYRKNVVPIGD